MSSPIRPVVVVAVALLCAAPVAADLSVDHPGPEIRQKAPETVRGIDPELRRSAMRSLHERLTAERVEAPVDTALVVPVDLEMVRELVRDEELRRERKLRIGVVVDTEVPVDLSAVSFFDLDRKAEPLRFGAVAEADGGRFVWSGAVRSPGADSLRVLVAGLDLPLGVELYAYGRDGEAYGPWTGAGPHDTGELWTPSVSGDTVILQLRSDGPATPEQLYGTRIAIRGVGHVNPALLRAAAVPQATGDCFSGSATCVENAGCTSHNAVTDAEKAVAHIRFVSGRWLYICSGGLLADSDESSTIPYFLTANHCISKDREANSLETYFDYTATCGADSNCDPGSRNTYGATIVSSSSTSDYTLLRLDQAPSGTRAYLGWSTDPIAFTGGADLHRISHPSGNPQAYSSHDVDTSKVTCSSWPRGDWIYSIDVTGATEGGSSGSPVVNGSGQVVGQLSGACGYNTGDVCDEQSNATVDGAFAAYYAQVEPWLGAGGCGGDCTDADGDGHCSVATGGDDCDDGDAAINPGAAEICGNDIDENCDGIADSCSTDCTDADGDGYTTCDGDCDDTDPSINPGAKDRGGPRWSDGVDNDCDGKIDG